MITLQNIRHILWNELTTSRASLPKDAQQDAQLYARIFMVLGMICVIVIILAITIGAWVGVALTIPSVLGNYILYRVSRTHHYHFAPPVAISLVTILNWVDIIYVSQGSDIWILGGTIYLAAFFYKVRGLLIWSVISLSSVIIGLSLTGLPIFTPSLILTMGFMGVIIINKATVQHRNLLLKKSEARLRAAIDGSLDTFFLLTHMEDTGEFHITDANTVAATMVNKKFPHLMVGSTLANGLATAVLPHQQMLTDCQQAVLRQENMHQETELENGRWIEYQIIPFEQNIALTIRDITRRKEAAAQSFQLAIEQERVSILTNFITDASHEFRTPLTAIETSNFLLTNSKKPEQKQKHSKRITQQVQHIVRLVDKLAFFSELETVNQLKTESTAIQTVLTHLEQTYMTQLEENGLTLHITHPADTPFHLPLHTKYFTIALQELMANSIRHSSAGGTIQVNTSHNTQTATITIEDTAPPIPADILPQIFDLFFREDEAHTTSGFGLGLPIAQRVIKLHEGVITIQPNTEVGNITKITLPLAADATVLFQ